MKLIRSTILLFFMYFTTLTCQNYTSGISGLIIDIDTQEAVSYANVFIPFTTIGTISDSLGRFMLSKLMGKTITIEIRHLSYEPMQIAVNPEETENKDITIKLKKKIVPINEVVKSVKTIGLNRGLGIFRKYFLGDDVGLSCYIENPQDLHFYYENNFLKCFSDNPLIITNKFLGYRVVYYLDYFYYWNEENNERYSFSGSAFFEDLGSGTNFKNIHWNDRRQELAHGSLNRLIEEIADSDNNEPNYYCTLTSNSKNKFYNRHGVNNRNYQISKMNIDSVYTFNESIQDFEYFYFSYNKPYSFKINKRSNYEKVINIDDSLLVIYNNRNVLDEERQTETYLLYIDSGKLSYNTTQKLVTYDGTLTWCFINDKRSIRLMVPLNYNPKS